MTLVIDRRDELGDGPGTHALICGIGEYPHLPGGSGPPTRFDIPLQQLTSPYRTARAFVEWVRRNADRLAAPLATCRVLLSAPADAVGSTPPDDAEIEAPTLRNLLEAAAAWRADAATHRDSMTLFYFGGHGLAVSRSEQIALLADFGDGVGPVLGNTISVNSMVEGMAPTTRWLPEIARTQLYFLDFGQSMTSLLDEFVASTPTDVFDRALETNEDRVAVVFYAAARGQPAYGRAQGLTLFGEALLDCLNGAAAEQVGDGGWSVTTTELARVLPQRLQALTAEFGISQEVTVSGLIGPAVVARAPEAPSVAVEIDLSGEVGPQAVLRVRDSELRDVLEKPGPFPPTLEIELGAGVYLFELTEPGRDHRALMTVTPPRTRLTLVGSTG
jgi:hypothetical protein